MTLRTRIINKITAKIMKAAKLGNTIAAKFAPSIAPTTNAKITARMVIIRSTQHLPHGHPPELSLNI